MGEILEIKNTEIENDELVFLTPMDIAKAMGCSVPAARQLFHRPDFPSIQVGKNFKVLKSAFIKWCSEKHCD